MRDSEDFIIFGFLVTILNLKIIVLNLKIMFHTCVYFSFHFLKFLF